MEYTYESNWPALGSSGRVGTQQSPGSPERVGTLQALESPGSVNTQQAPGSQGGWVHSNHQGPQGWRGYTARTRVPREGGSSPVTLMQQVMTNLMKVSVY